ncbi:MAG: response regulator [Myxococcales bacterium]
MTCTALLIEDNEQNRYLATFLLEQRGYRVVPAPDGLQAIALARSFVPDLILLDIQLPVMDGYAVARALRDIESLRRIPIIAVTSYAMVGDREKALAAGCDGYLEKPIDPETFVSAIEAFGAHASGPEEQP